MSTLFATRIARRASFCLLLASSATAAWAGWGPDGVTISSTAAPLVSACSDGDIGTFVAWQDGVIRVQHVLTTGDLDPTWPALGAIACDVAATRGTMRALPDRLGGVYLWWLEERALYATRLDAGGQVAPGWPQRGRLLGITSQLSPIPSVFEDGTHGFYAVWSEITTSPSIVGALLAIHVGPENTGAGGWPNQAVPAVTDDAVATVKNWPAAALAPDGGMFVAWVSWSMDTLALPSTMRLKRLTSAGSTAPGWADDGLEITPYFGEFWWYTQGAPTRSMLALSADARGGVFLLAGRFDYFDPSGFYATVSTRLYRRQGDGSTAPDWPLEGRVDPEGYSYYSTGTSLDAGYKVFPDGLDGAVAGEPIFSDHATDYGFRRFLPSGQWDWYSDISGDLVGHEEFPKGDGGMFVANFKASGPSSIWDRYAALHVGQSRAPGGWADWWEIRTDPMIHWYGDIALAPSGDGGAVFFWSQVRDRVGLFARRFWRGGQVTDVAAAPATIHLSGLRFAPGAGVRAYVTVPASQSARLELYDVSGRRVSSQALEPSATRQVTLPGTANLAAGVFFARLVSGPQSLTGRVLVIH